MVFFVLSLGECTSTCRARPPTGKLQVSVLLLSRARGCDVLRPWLFAAAKLDGVSVLGRGAQKGHKCC